LRGSCTNGSRSVTSWRPSVTLKKKRSAPHGRAHLRRRGAGGRQMQVTAPQILRIRLIGGAAEENGEVLHSADVCFLGPRRQSAACHVFDHAPA
jgi:hypothetical protein